MFSLDNCLTSSSNQNVWVCACIYLCMFVCVNHKCGLDCRFPVFIVLNRLGTSMQCVFTILYDVISISQSSVYLRLQNRITHSYSKVNTGHLVRPDFLIYSPQNWTTCVKTKNPLNSYKDFKNYGPQICFYFKCSGQPPKAHTVYMRWSYVAYT